MQNQEESLLYGLRLITRVLGVLLLFNIVNGVGTVVNEYKNSRHPNVEVQVDTCIIHDTIFVDKPKRWGIGLQAGYGVALHINQVFPAPYIGVGVSWNFLQF